MPLKLANNATSTLANAIATGATQIVIQSADAARFPTLSGGDWHPVTVVDGSGNLEVMRATARSGATITVQRAQEGTSAVAFEAGARVDLRMTAAALAEYALAADLANKAPLASPTFTGTVAGVTKAMVGLGNVENTADVDKPISNAVQTALNGKQNSLSTVTEVDAIAGTSTSVRNWTAQRVRQAILAVAASAADFLGGVADKYLTAANVWSSAEHTDRGNLTGTVTWDFGAYTNAKGAMTGNITLGTISNAKKGKSGVLELTHSGGARTISHNSSFWETANGQALEPSTEAGAKDVLVYVVQDNGKALVTLHRGVA